MSNWTPRDFTSQLNQVCQDTEFKHESDLIIASVHACLCLAGFRLKNESASSTSSPILLPKAWNASPYELLSWTYKYSNQLYHVKYVPLGTHVLVHAVDLGKRNKILSVDFDTNDHLVTPVSFPKATPSSSENTINMWLSCYRNVDQFMQQCKAFISNLFGPEPWSTTPAVSASASVLPPPTFSSVPPVAPTATTSGQRSPYSIGHRDLDPLGGHAPVMPPPFGGAAYPPTRPVASMIDNEDDDGGGSMMCPGHPLFHRESRLHPLSPDWNRDSRLPPGAVPPGARFDPIVPGSLPPRGGPHGLPPFPGPGRGGNAQPFSGEPDNNLFPPPGPPSGFF